jgi:hypothetical protein
LQVIFSSLWLPIYIETFLKSARGISVESFQGTLEVYDASKAVDKVSRGSRVANTTAVLIHSNSLFITID